MRIIEAPSPNFGPRRAPVDMLVLHYTGMTDMESALARLRDAQAAVSAHYLIDEDGTLYALVPEESRAWHAGLSWWRGEGDVNSRSVGIELVNPGHEFGYRPFPEAQIAVLIDLARAVLVRHAIPPRNVVGHADVAPARRQDPGELFPWARLAEAGVGLFPAAEGSAALAEDDGLAALAAYGYDVTDPAAAVTAFQRHFRPRAVTGSFDAETLGRLARLTALAG